MTGGPPGEPQDPGGAEKGTSRRWLLPAAVLLAVAWAAGLGTLAATTANPPTLNRAQLLRADALLWAEVRAVDDDTARLTVKEVGFAGPAAAELAVGTGLTVRRFPAGAADAGELRAVPVRRVAGGWEVAASRDGLPRFVYAGGWPDLSAAAARVRRAEPAYR